MTNVTFGRLIDLPLREAWKHEALEFTPWLAENIDHLSDVIGIPLELTGQEVRVETFAADILARNPSDDSVVLIENQLEQTDHTHLGQIMTYLAGLDAQTVVWIAPDFRQPHLSAIRWLNEHTADGFAFFAVKARVVRIADSPFAPIFEVVEKPNDWERQLSGHRKSAQHGNSEIGDKREEYWRAYTTRHPNSRVTAGRGGWISFTPPLANIAKVVLWIGQTEGGIFVRNHFSLASEDFMARVHPHIVKLEERLGIENSIGDGTIFGQRWPASVNDPTTWPEIQDRQERELERYISALDEILGETS
jgi:hypothetical protein